MKRAIIIFFAIHHSISDQVLNYNDSSQYFDDALFNETEAEITILEQYPSVYRLCPFINDDPCECSISQTDGEQTFSVVCSDLNDKNILPNMMEKLRSTNVSKSLHSLFLFRSKVELPKMDLFLDLPFRTIRIIDSEVMLSYSNEEARSPDKFRPLLGGLEESLEEAAFRNTVVPGVENKSCIMGSLSKLRRFSLINAAVSQIPKEFFCCSYLNIMQVYLNGNSLKDLPDGGLSRANNIKIIMLNHNQIFIVSRFFFPSPANQLEEMHLRNNRIQTLPRDFFQEMPALRYVDLSENRMESLPSAVWQPIWSNLLDIYLQENSLICDCTFKWLIDVEQQLSREFKRIRFLEGICEVEDGNASFPVDQIQQYFDDYQCLNRDDL